MMNQAEQQFIALAATLAKQLPPSTLELIACVIEEAHQSHPLSPQTRISQVVSQPYHRSLALNFLNDWQTNASNVSPQAAALALRTAAHVHRLHAEKEQAELAWTGPASNTVPFRRTEQAILQILESAAKRITLVSFAVYRVPQVCAAIVRAAARGVQIVVIVETPDKLEGENEYSTLRALGRDVAACSSVYYWPADKRGRADHEKLGILHVKCVVADRRWLFLSSANLTEYAFTVNMELGILITGGKLPKQVDETFDELIRTHTLEKLHPGP